MHTVIFDMDGLLLDTERVYMDTFIETRRLLGLPDSEDVFLRCVGGSQSAADAIIQDSLSKDVSLEAFNTEWITRRTARLQASIARKPGAKKLLEILSAKGCKLGVATSTQTPIARERLRKAGLLDHFAHVIGGDLVQKHKPDPETYLKVATLLNTNPHDCFAFEDSNTGTRAAVASGAKTVQIPDLIEPTEDIKALGHTIAPDLLNGAIAVGLIQPNDL